MTIIKIRKPLLTTLHPLPDYGGVWRVRVSIPSYSQPSIFDATDFDFSGVYQETVEIGDVFVDGISYTEEDILADCRTNKSTWYFDETNQILYIHVPDYTRLDSSDLNTQETFGFSSGRVFYDDNNKAYLPLLDSDTVIEESADRLVYEKMTLAENTIKLNNKSGTFDVFFDNPTPGSNIEFNYISDADVEAGKTGLTPVYVAYVDNDTFGRESYSITSKDKRAQFTQLWPENLFTSDDYPNADDDVIGEVIPDGYGSVKGMEAYCTNGTVTTGDVNYRFAELYTSGLTVYVKDDDDNWQSVTPSSSDSSTGSFVLSSTDGREDSGDPRECKVDAVLRTTDGNYAPEIVIDLLPVDYTTEFYDTEQVESELDYFTGAGIGFYSNEQEELLDYIEQLQGADTRGWRFFTRFDGKYSIKVDDIDRAVSRSYMPIENIDDNIECSRDLEDYATSVKVNYSFDYADDTNSSVIDDSRETSVFNIYRVYSQQEFDSLLTTQTDAETKANYIARDYSLSRAEIPVTIRGVVPTEIYDVIEFDTAIVQAGVRVREFLGVRKLKVSSVEYDFANAQTTITGIDITTEVE